MNASLDLYVCFQWTKFTNRHLQSQHTNKSKSKTKANTKSNKYMNSSFRSDSMRDSCKEFLKYHNLDFTTDDFDVS